ncbi:MAG: hypothetical protein OXR73_35800 [Myxococcales bacterium]|nr:hypothetical protein [Myxococcales bacterium]
MQMRDGFGTRNLALGAGVSAVAFSSVCALVLTASTAAAHRPGWSVEDGSGAVPSERSRPAVAALGKRIYLFGGLFDDFSSGEFVGLDDLYRYDTRSDRWSRLAPEGPGPEARGFAGYAAVPQKRGFAVFGGGVYGADLNVTIFQDLWLYTPADNRWTEVIADNDGPPPRFDPKMWADGDTLYVFGGLNEQFSVNNDLWAYSFATNRWRLVTEQGAEGSPSPRANAVGPDGARRGKLYLYGGEGSPDLGFPILGDVWQFDVQTQRWQELSPDDGSTAPEPRNHGSVVWIDGALYLYGGDVSGGTRGCGAPFPQNPIGEMWRFAPGGRRWQRVEILRAPGPLKRHVGVAVGRSMYLLGGYDFAVRGSEAEPCQVWNLSVHRYRPSRWVGLR